MKIDFLSLSDDCPVGFEKKMLVKKDMLAHTIVLFADSLEQVYDTLGDLKSRVQGIIVTVEQYFGIVPVTDKLFHLTITSNYISNVVSVASSFALLIEDRIALLDQYNIISSDKQRLDLHQMQLRENYNSAIQRLEVQIESLREEVNRREKVELELHRQNAEYIKINNKLRVYQEELVAKSQQLIESNKELIESRLKAEESNQLKTEFIRNMSHEIRTPLNSIIGFSELISDGSISQTEKGNFVKILINSGAQLTRIVEDILEISSLGTKQQKIDEKIISINNLLDEQYAIFDLIAKERNVELILKKGLPNNLSNIFSDEYKLLRIINNLIENALKFTNEGFIEFGYVVKNRSKVSSDEVIEFYIKDSGIGIEHSQFNRIFDRFSQADKDISRKVGGLGLGLSIAKENAELLGGNITLESVKGIGTTFYFTMPFRPALIKTSN
ncbi:MAG: HAMP domain-containing histidine kinase [Marinilabiliaceae bacterium]|nr:HAMP domain-containing histidine kinase [Marinilabiliaceae bacterium]